MIVERLNLVKDTPLFIYKECYLVVRTSTRDTPFNKDYYKICFPLTYGYIVEYAFPPKHLSNWNMDRKIAKIKSALLKDCSITEYLELYSNAVVKLEDLLHYGDFSFRARN